MIDRTAATGWVERWDRQQERYAEHREDRFAAMAALVERATASHEHPVIVDIGAGPGSLAARLAHHLPRARVVAVESDAFLVALGRAWCGDLVEFATETAGSPGWRSRLGLPQVHAVVASSALHYPPVTRLRTLYAEILDWLTADGVIVNADHFPDVGDGELASAPDLGPWTRWWEDATASEQLAPLFALRADTTAEAADAEGDNDLTASQHLALLTSVGFTSAELAWRRGRSAILAAYP